MTVSHVTGKPFPRGAKRSPVHKILAATKHEVIKTPPPQFAAFPAQLDMWDNDVDGCCVTSEEAEAKGAYSVMCGLPDLFIPTAEVIRWATKYGFLNGADLSSVMDQMAIDGFTVNGVNYKDGPPSVVDYSQPSMNQSAISTGPVKIAIDANALPSGAGNQMGWSAVGGSLGQFGNTDHCVNLTAYGTAQYIYDQLSATYGATPLPAGLDPNAQGYGLYTWKTIGFVDQPWLMSTCVEAWVRNPTTPGQGPAPVPPVPPSPPIPVPPIPPPTPGAFPNYGVFYNGTQLAGLTLQPITSGTAVEQVLNLAFADGRVQAALAAFQFQRGSGPFSGLLIKIIAAIVPVIMTDLAAGKTIQQIVPDVIQAILRVVAGG